MDYDLQEFSPSDGLLITPLCLLKMDHHLDLLSFKTYLLSTESFHINEEINDDP